MEENFEQQQSAIIKIAFYGPESTGKTTLAMQLANYYKTVMVPEFARNYLQEKWDTSKTVCTPDDLLPIALGQIKSENDALSKANKIIFCDTNLLATKAYSEIYYNSCNPIIDELAKKHLYDLVFLTSIDVPWEKDDLRDKPNERETVFEKFESVLIETNKPYLILSGDKNERFEKSVAIVNDLIKAKNLGFSSHDFVQIYTHGIIIDNLENQLEIFKSEIPKVALARHASIDDGILLPSTAEFEKLALYFDANKDSLKLKKFVPASGAASRMFHFLNEFLNTFNPETDTINSYINKNNANELSIFLAGMEKFPFFDFIDTQLNKNLEFKNWSRDKKNYEFIKYLLTKNYLDYANKPKGVLPFHTYENNIATPIEEHLKESVLYAKSGDVANIHFTISETHQEAFENIINKIRAKIENDAVARINVKFSYQDKSTDVIAVNLANEAFRDSNENLVFRPGGHGALIENVNNLDADIVFIKNIDNVIQNNLQLIALYKKGLAGLLLQLQNQIFDYLTAIALNKITSKDIAEIIYFAKEKLNISLKDDLEKYSFENQLEYLNNILNRPIRVCGMVKNEGEPGGGPFWVRDYKGNISLQIIESSQIDLENKVQADIFANSTHFNPVDLVCGIKNYQSEKFDLKQFIDPKSGFIVHKNSKGKALKGYELPGLWNGAMAHWITIFVEVPIITFNPVKTVNDLLKPTHQK